MDNVNITCRNDLSRISGKQLGNILYEHGITPDAAGRNFLDRLSDGEMVCEALCGTEMGPQNGSLLMVVKVSLPQADWLERLLTELTGDNKLAELFDVSGPAYVRVLRCRPVFWQALKQSCLKLLARVTGG